MPSSKAEPAQAERQPVLFNGLPTEALTASMMPESLDSERRSVDVVFFTGIDVPRYDYWKGEPYILRFSPKGADLSYLNNGAPVFDNHDSYEGAAGQMGVVDKAWQDGTDFKATLRFSKRDEVAGLWRDIQDKIVQKFSMGVSILAKQEIAQDKDKLRVVEVTKWQPYEISTAPIPADFNTRTLKAEKEAVRAASPKEQSMQQESINNAGDGARDVQLAAQEALADQLKAGKELGITQELARVTTINKTARALNLSASFASKHIENRTNVEEFRRLAIDEQARISVTFGGGDTVGVRTQVMRDEADTRRELMAVAVLGMMSPKDRKADGQNNFIGLSIFQIAQESVRLQFGLAGVPTKANVANLAMQATSDFTSVLENTARKQLQNRYELANPTYRMWAKKSTTPDFKTMSRPRLGEAPTFVGVPEGAQITISTMTDSKESYALATYGRGVSFTRQMLINDDLGAFNDLIGAFGSQAARLENKTVYAILTANAAMSDSVTLFHATHSNSGTGVIGNTALDSMFTAMGTQKGVDGVSVLNLTPRFLIVPKAKESTARAALMQIGPNVKASDQNWFAGRLEPVADAELDATSTAVWYAACDPADAPGVEYAHLEGADGPQFVRKENESGILGIQFYAYVDFGAKAIDWRPLYYSTGS